MKAIMPELATPPTDAEARRIIASIDRLPDRFLLTPADGAIGDKQEVMRIAALVRVYAARTALQLSKSDQNKLHRHLLTCSYWLLKKRDKVDAYIATFDNPRQARTYLMHVQVNHLLEQLCDMLDMNHQQLEAECERRFG